MILIVIKTIKRNYLTVPRKSNESYIIKLVFLLNIFKNIDLQLKKEKMYFHKNNIFYIWLDIPLYWFLIILFCLD